MFETLRAAFNNKRASFAILVAVATVGILSSVLIWPPGPRSPFAVVGLPHTPDGPRLVADASFNYPQAAAIADDGSIYIANSLGLTVERVQGDSIQTVMRQAGTGERINRYNDVILDGADGLLVADADGAAIYRLNLKTGETRLVANAPQVGIEHGDYLSIAGMDRAGDKLLIVGTAVRPVTASSVYGVGASSIFTHDAVGWHHIVDAPKINGEPTDFRDAIFTSEGGFAAIAGNEFMTMSPDGSILRTVSIPAKVGGGILEGKHFWIVGAHTQVLKIPKDLSSFRPIPVFEQIANIGNIADAGRGRILITDSDRQSVYLVDLNSGKVLRQIGNTASNTKIVDLAAGSDGKVLMLENAAPKILRYDTGNRNTEVVAGNGKQAYSDPAPALDFSFQYPNCLAVGPDGAIYVTESNYRIIRIKDGLATVFAGDIHPGKPVEGQDKNEARFGSLYGIDVDSQSRVWVVDQGNNTVWRIEADGKLTRIMGTGEPGEWKEGKLASSQPLQTPNDVLVRKDGSVLISDTYNSVVARIGVDGIARRFAGRFHTLHYQGYGFPFAGDGELATEADLNTPLALAEGPDGSVYIMDSFNNRVRRVGPDGIIATVAGGGFGTSDDASRLNHATSVAVVGDQLYVADTGNGVVWSVPLK